MLRSARTRSYIVTVASLAVFGISQARIVRDIRDWSAYVGLAKIVPQG